ncbi:MAG TPA: hypothetical protein VLJ59_07730 [Mycobacteriales bacterium]|nr:hypothetical protein [Mycobacteriales bacterium]
MTTISNEANFYSVEGQHLHVTLSPTLDGGLQLSYQDPSTHRLFQKDEVQREATALGVIVTVVLSQIPDLGSTTFSLLVPTVRLGPGESAHVSTLGVTTIHRTSIAPILDRGQQDSYTVVRLRGTASFVQT